MEAGEWRERETLDQQGQFSQGGPVAHTVQYVHFHSDKTFLRFGVLALSSRASPIPAWVTKLLWDQPNQRKPRLEPTHHTPPRRRNHRPSPPR